jgi:transcriptional regulator with XRE-family HTH domain
LFLHLLALAAANAAMSKSKLPPEAAARVERLKKLRYALGVPSQAAMADLLGIELGRWNHYERGMPLSLPVAQLICRRFAGMSLDWLYEGNPRGLSFEMAVRLGELPSPSPVTIRTKGR